MKNQRLYKGKFTEKQVLNMVLKKQGITFKKVWTLISKHGSHVPTLIINFKESNNDIGNRTCGKIDFLKNYCGFTIVYK